jgi:hypothetical protein
VLLPRSDGGETSTDTRPRPALPREHLEAVGVGIVHDSDWGGRGRSFYFEDPAGNLLEIADCDFWPFAGQPSSRAARA